jgi:hypothetical protein
VAIWLLSLGQPLEGVEITRLCSIRGPRDKPPGSDLAQPGEHHAASSEVAPIALMASTIGSRLAAKASFRVALHLDLEDDSLLAMLLARKIIALAKDGELSPDLLCERALAGIANQPPRV